MDRFGSLSPPYYLNCLFTVFVEPSPTSATNISHYIFINGVKPNDMKICLLCSLSRYMPVPNSFPRLIIIVVIRNE